MECHKGFESSFSLQNHDYSGETSSFRRASRSNSMTARAFSAFDEQRRSEKKRLVSNSIN